MGAVVISSRTLPTRRRSWRRHPAAGGVTWAAERPAGRVVDADMSRGEASGKRTTDRCSDTSSVTPEHGVTEGGTARSLDHLGDLISAHLVEECEDGRAQSLRLLSFGGRHPARRQYPIQGRVREEGYDGSDEHDRRNFAVQRMWEKAPQPVGLARRQKRRHISEGIVGVSRPWV